MHIIDNPTNNFATDPEFHVNTDKSQTFRLVIVITVLESTNYLHVRTSSRCTLPLCVMARQDRLYQPPHYAWLLTLDTNKTLLFSTQLQKTSILVCY